MKKMAFLMILGLIIGVAGCGGGGGSSVTGVVPTALDGNWKLNIVETVWTNGETTANWEYTHLNIANSIFRMTMFNTENGDATGNGTGIFSELNNSTMTSITSSTFVVNNGGTPITVAYVLSNSNNKLTLTAAGNTDVDVYDRVSQVRNLVGTWNGNIAALGGAITLTITAQNAMEISGSTNTQGTITNGGTFDNSVVFWTNQTMSFWGTTDGSTMTLNWSNHDGTITGTSAVFTKQ